MIPSPATIAILYPGEMGAAFGALLGRRGHTIVTTAAGRSARTMSRAREAGFVVLDTLEDVARRADVVISLVSPAAARSAAESYLACAPLVPKHAIFVDCNSIGPELIRSMQAPFDHAGIDLVDAAINGLAAKLVGGGTLLLSGHAAPEIAVLAGDAMRIRIVGDEIGAASAMKMLLSGISKGVCAIYMELASLAREQGISQSADELIAEIYPGIWALVQRMLPTYEQHAERRATEMQELEHTARSAGIEPIVLKAIRELHEQITERQVVFEE
jgi:3-hydroxyisobutyrate dehydrogenase-like beta-hydroxyacid dehydrogenase